MDRLRLQWRRSIQRGWFRELDDVKQNRLKHLQYYVCAIVICHRPRFENRLTRKPSQ